MDKTVATVERLPGGLALVISLAAVVCLAIVTIVLPPPVAPRAALSADKAGRVLAGHGSGAMLPLHGSTSSIAWSISSAVKGSLGVDLRLAGLVRETGPDGTESSVEEVQHGASEVGAVG